MAEKNWEKFQTRFCDQADMDVSLDVEVIYPAEYLDHEAPRLGAHRCSNGMVCNQFDQGVCIWSGTNPAVDPFKDQ
jgi:hypothetical protein